MAGLSKIWASIGSSDFRIKILILLFELGFALKFNIVGTISISELFLICAAPFYLPTIKWKEKDLFTILVLYVALFCAQLISEVIVGNSMGNMMKGLAVTVVSFLHFAFLFKFLKKDKSLITFIVLSIVISQLIVGPEDFIRERELSLEDVAMGTGAALLKFYIAPLLINVMLLFSIIFKRNIFPMLLILMGLVFVILGARSAGMLSFLTGVVAMLAEFKPKLFSRRNLPKTIGIIALCSYILYVIYVSVSLNGAIASGNTKQLLVCNNPYNPLELLIRGRAETWVGWRAFQDKFLFGHGAWAYDYTGHYRQMMQELHSSTQGGITETDYLVPSHSLIIGTGVANGLLAFLLIIALIGYFFKSGIFSIGKVEKKYRLVFIYSLLILVWDAMFSPISHFRQTIPLYCAMIFILQRRKKRRIEQNLTPCPKTEES